MILANAYKLDQINELGLDVPVDHLVETLYIDNEWRELPDSLLKILPEREKAIFDADAKNSKLDEGILEEAARIGKILTLEDGSLKGGVFGAVAEYMAQHGHQVLLRGHGIPDAFIVQDDTGGLKLFVYLRLDLL